MRFAAEQLDVEPDEFAAYGVRRQNRYEHAWEIRDAYGYRAFPAAEDGAQPLRRKHLPGPRGTREGPGVPRGRRSGPGRLRNPVSALSDGTHQLIAESLLTGPILPKGFHGCGAGGRRRSC
ncbi:DUF4158 domain-containing protein [Streptomyces goshikiensis]|uniref:DUF4158 domain-containing protein n=1 Tax=Streptomyces goshikiensis TaxID=1942 RepID=UPI00371C6BE7